MPKTSIRRELSVRLGPQEIHGELGELCGSGTRSRLSELLRHVSKV
jgi:hypothetical protein